MMNTIGRTGTVGRSSFGKMQSIQFSNMMCDTKPCYEMSYHIHPDDVQDDTVDAQVVVVLTLHANHDAHVRAFVQSFKSSGLASKTTRLFLRFDGEANRRILNYCKMTFRAVEVLSKRDGEMGSIFPFLQTQSIQWMGKTTTTAGSGEGDVDRFILSYDLTRLNSESIGDWMLKHTIDEWRMCLRLFQEYSNVRAVGMFPLREKDPQGKDFAFDTFWLRLRSSNHVITQLGTTDKMEILDCSKNGWFASDEQIEASRFKLKEEEDGLCLNENEEVVSSRTGRCVGGVCPVVKSRPSTTATALLSSSIEKAVAAQVETEP